MPLFQRKTKTPLGIYIHIPFCKAKCQYCDFYSVTCKEDGLMDRYMQAICTHIEETAPQAPGYQVDTFIKYTHALAEEFNVRIPSFGHAGDGNLHIYICRDALNDGDWEAVKAACFDRMYAKAEELGGLVSGEHGIGYAKKEFLKRQYGQTPIALMQGIKQVFDPKNILNPGKVCF